MNIWTKFCCSLIILNYVEMKSLKGTKKLILTKMHTWVICIDVVCLHQLVEYEFHTMHLGHTGLLIFWDPQGASGILFIKYHAIGKIVIANISEQVLATDGQYKLNSILIENTDYEITVTTEGSNEKKIIKAKTGLKKNSVPEKPDFTWYLNNVYTSFNKEVKIRIAWIPCGKQRNCHGNEPGTHFAVRYKLLDRRGTFTVAPKTQGYVDIPYIYAGHIYEVIVCSINGDFQTDSDSQEIFHVPYSNPVHSVNVLTLSNSSIYISWEKPQQSIDEVQEYHLYVSTAINSSYSFHGESLSSATKQPRGSKIINGLILNTQFTISIVPYFLTMIKLMPGFAYTFDYLILPVRAINFTLAKPDFKIKYIGSECSYLISWIPCGETHDCKNMSPGSAFEVNIESGNHKPKTVLEKVKDWTMIDTPNNRISRITVKSVNEFNQSSESVTKTINCNKKYRLY